MRHAEYQRERKTESDFINQKARHDAPWGQKRKGDRDENRIGVVANRVKRNTLIYQSLMRFLETLRIPVIATLRDSQNYVRAAEQGVGLHEMKKQLVAQDLEDWEPLLGWLRAKEASGAPQIVNPLQETA